MVERRKARRIPVDFDVTETVNGVPHDCQACEISPTGIRMVRRSESARGADLVQIEIPLVPGGITTVFTARRVWQRGGHEAFEFVSPTFAQQAVLERRLGNI
ncbi:MAG: PilZ domain-containing protein [Deltaproteobacteria bacterium]|nr:PilZ domain-containing protein [Deltaproteobacteria bacterium]